MKIAVTGCNGRVGRRVVIHCLNEGHSVVGVDFSDPPLDDVAVRRATEHEAFSFVKTDLREYDEVVKVLRGCDAVAHLAAFPNPGDGKVQTHNSNVVISWNMLRASAELGIKRIAQASTCNVVQLVYSKNGPNPKYFPIDEDIPCDPDEPYGLSKLIAEIQAESIVRRYPEMRIASLRMHWAVPDRAYATRDTPERRRKDLWGWLHHDSAASAFLLALTVGEDRFKGHEAFYIAAPDSAEEWDSEDLRQQFYPDVPVKEGKTLSSNESFICCEKARRMLGWVHKEPTGE
ncbi:NAD-binding protein [Fomitiporia mediterranea MF3/22]|uniref:NAD-binding protein n=1 Tax=Fomitiporia mediterranea (strain MF3/22) TaxID=694068 RepID=UPI0004409A87|nr:NAD-binding protein [Fomitiporia mediterranea MF3/22]EJD06878.1 NAD-binding protein [Fomitiporia mediterranea MF3/22]